MTLLLQAVFDAIDVNNDGVISFDEAVFAITDYWFCAGPDSVFNNLYGPIVDA